MEEVAVARWTRNASILMYLVPVGSIPPDLFASYVQLLQEQSVVHVNTLTRPSGYASELSPFKSFAWDQSDACFRFRFVASSSITAVDGEEVHACHRPLGVIGICHCPSTAALKPAYDHFLHSIQHMRGLVITKCFAFEHAFDQSVSDCAQMPQLILFPAHQELPDVQSSTVRLHLQVVLDTICVTLLLSLESTVRAAIKSLTVDTSEGLLDTHVEPHASTHSPNGKQPPQQRMNLSLAGLTNALSLDPRHRKRQIARQRKLCGDFALMVSCVTDAIEHYTAAMELLRDEEKRSNGALGDVLWLAGAIEGYVCCLCWESRDRFVVEIIDRASEALMLFARVGVVELESLLLEHVGWYLVGVAMQLTRGPKSKDRVEELVWTKRLLYETIARALSVFPQLTSSRQLEFLMQCARMLECVGHRRRMAMMLHEAASVLIHRHRLISSSPTSISSVKDRDLRIAWRLEQMVATRLNMAIDLSLYHQQTKYTKTKDHTWLLLQFHVRRQMLTIAQMLSDPFLIASASVQLLQVLSWCDTSTSSSKPLLVPPVEQPQTPFTSALSAMEASSRGPLYHKTSVYYTPPSSIETKSKRLLFSHSPVASISSTIANTPRMLSTPRHQISQAIASFHHPSPSATESPKPSVEPNEPVESLLLDADLSFDRFASIYSPWNLRAREDVVLMQQNVLKILETECQSIRPNETRPIPAFVSVDAIQTVRRDRHHHPFLTKDHAMALDPSHKPHKTTKSDFFYSPFDKKQTPVEEKHTYVDGFPVYERLELDLVVSNPLGVGLHIQQCAVMCEAEDAVEIYPRSFSLRPYEAQKRVTLAICPLRPGRLAISGVCFKMFQLHLSFSLSLNLTIVQRLPQLSIALVEFGRDEEVVAERSGLEDWRLSLFTNETKRCALQWKKRTRTIPITRLCVAVRLLQRQKLKKTLVILNQLTNETLQPPVVVENDHFQMEILKIQDNRIEFSLMVTSSEVDQTLEWRVLYAAAEDSYYREVKAPIQLVVVPSLRLSAASILPLAAATDCLLVVDVTNPTETTFCVRLHPTNQQNSIATVEIGRKCRRRLAIALDKVQAVANVIEHLNDAVVLEWRTFFGSTGSLRFHEKLNIEGATQLLLAPMALEIKSPAMRLVQAKDSEPASFVSCKKAPTQQKMVHATLLEPFPVSMDVTWQSIPSIVQLNVLIQAHDHLNDLHDAVLISGALQKQLTPEETTHTIQLLFLSTGAFRLTASATLANETITCQAPLWIQITE